MKKTLKRTLIIVALVIVVLFGILSFMNYQTKKHSPEATAELVQGDKKISVHYCRPYKKGRVIFDSLVPYGKVWRTGANEATTFETSSSLVIDGKSLVPGKYTLWTIPNKEEWIVILNGKQYNWGVNFDQQAAREPEADVLQTKVPVENSPNPIEQFTISFEENPVKMVLAWDKTRVAVPIEVK